MNASVSRIFSLVRAELWQRRSFRRRLMIISGIFAFLGLLGTVFIGLFSSVYHIRVVADVTKPSGSVFFLVVGSIGMVCILISVLSYFLHALFDERLDRSILFWQSLPVSEAERVTSKVITGLVAIPLRVWAYVMAIALIILFFLSLSTSLLGYNFWASFWQIGPLVSVTGFLAVFFPLSMLWLFPLLGWCLFCSAWGNPSRRKSAFLLAIGIPLLLWILEHILFGTNYLGDWWQMLFSPFGHVWHRAFLGIARWRNEMGTLWDLIGWMLGQSEFWLGGLVGVGFSASAIYLLRRQDPPS